MIRYELVGSCRRGELALWFVVRALVCDSADEPATTSSVGLFAQNDAGVWRQADAFQDDGLIQSDRE